VPSEEEECERCSHPFDPHLVIATGETPFDGGIIICNVKGCQCYGTWDVPQLGGRREDIDEPDRAELEEMRERMQT